MLRYAFVALAVVVFFWKQRPLADPAAIVPHLPAREPRNRSLHRRSGPPGTPEPNSWRMKVLDAGCGPGRLTVPVARAVGPGGQVVALDGQPAMLRKLQRKLDADGLANVSVLRAELGEGALDEGGFDRVLLVAVLSARCATARQGCSNSTRR